MTPRFFSLLGCWWWLCPALDADPASRLGCALRAVWLLLLRRSSVCLPRRCLRSLLLLLLRRGSRSPRRSCLCFRAAVSASFSARVCLGSGLPTYQSVLDQEGMCTPYPSSTTRRLAKRACRRPGHVERRAPHFGPDSQCLYMPRPARSRDCSTVHQ